MHCGIRNILIDRRNLTFSRSKPTVSMFLYIIWPLDEPPPAWEDAEPIYDRLASGIEPKGMGRWFTDCLMGTHHNVVARMELGPYGFAHWYELIEEDGFPDDMGAWVSPDEMIAATEKLQSLIGNDDPDALTLVECFVRHNRSMDGPLPRPSEPMPRVLESEDPTAVGLYRAVALGDLLSNLEDVKQTAYNCKREGIERIAFCCT